MAAPAHAAAAAPKAGGILTVMQREPLPSMSIHEEATISTVWPMMPCYNNLVLFDPLRPQETLDTVGPNWPSAGKGGTAAGPRPSPCAFAWCATSACT